MVEGGALEGVIGDGESVGGVSHLGVWRRLLRGLWADGVACRGFCFLCFVFFLAMCSRELMELLKRIEKKLDVLQANSGSTLGYVQVTNQ